MPSADKNPTIPQQVLDLVDRFDRNRDAYKSANYNETQARREFLDPLFKALGWDIDNEQGYAEAYKDVIHEDAIKVGEATKAPDYCFRIGGARKFFLEAKKPALDIKNDVSPAFQLRRYAWTTKLPLSILSDFEEFAVYDCRFKPDQKDSAAVGRILYVAYTEYATRWHEIANVFSRDAVLKGSFDKYAESSKAKRGTADVDDEFLQTIETWRKELAENLALRNKKLSQRELNFAVQRIIDRIIFLRICEGRGIENYGRLQTLTNGDRIYPRLGKLFEQADDRYNSGLFHFKAEKGRHEAPDELTLGLDLDDKLLRGILKSLYYPESPYVFSALSVDVLGQVYEQFLGKVIRLTEGHHAKVEEKPEVKKAGGVFYTPTYIGEYLVQNTVGKLLDEIVAAVCDRRKASDKQDGGHRPPLQMNARQATEILSRVAKLRILDIACGSGSLLLCAYEHLLKRYLDFYTRNDPIKWARGSKPVLVQSSSGWRLTITERKRILLDNIYGVDIDAQAVETTKLSLLLKVLEGETSQTIQPELLHQRALPDLGNNIKCGNSLIGPDFYQQQQLTLLTQDERDRVNTFDWHAEFPEVFKAGGFDAVISNPPYLRIQGLQENYGSQIEYFAKSYESAVKRFDLYLLFSERGYNLLNKNGRLGFICPHKFLNSDFGSGLRQFLVKKRAVESFFSFGNNLVFRQASTYTGILILAKRDNSTFKYLKMPDVPAIELPGRLSIAKADEFSNIDVAGLTGKPWALTSSANQSLLEKLRKQPANVESIFEGVFQGVVTGIDDLYFLKPISQKGGIVEAEVLRDGRRIKIEKAILVPMLKGEDVSRYANAHAALCCIYPYKLVGEKTTILEETELSSRFPLAYAYLSEFKSELKKLRLKFKTNPRYWYSCHRGRSMSAFARERIITQEISLGCNMTLDSHGLYHNTTVYSLLPNASVSENILCWLGILNSKLMWWFLKNTGNVLRGGYFRFKTEYLNPFPLPRFVLSRTADKTRHDQMVKLVEQMLELHQRLSAAKTPPEKTSLERQIAATDTQIDRLVYELYGLTEDEIRIVEGPPVMPID
jgi:hypothetical protein